MIKFNYLKVLVFSVMVLSFFSCADEEVENEIVEPFSIEKASSEVTDIFNSWVNNSANGRLASGFGSEDVFAVTDNVDGQTLYGALDPNDQSTGVAFSIIDENVVNPFIIETNFISDTEIETKLFTLDNELLYTIHDIVNPGGIVRLVVSHSTDGRTEGWFDKFDDCIGKFHNPTGCNICDIAFVVIADAATATLYSWLSLAVCAGAASA